jgi:hypothetical protein
MEHQELLSEISSLPPEGQKQVADYIAFIRHRYSEANLNRKAELDLLSEEFVGIWKDRNNLEDSNAWVRNLRKSEWMG